MLIYAKLYSLHTKNFPSSEVIHGITTFKLIKNWQRLKKNDQLLNLMFLFFQFFIHISPYNKCHKQKWCVLFFTCIRLMVCMLAYVQCNGCNNIHLLHNYPTLEWKYFLFFHFAVYIIRQTSFMVRLKKMKSIVCLISGCYDFETMVWCMLAYVYHVFVYIIFYIICFLLSWPIFPLQFIAGCIT